MVLKNTLLKKREDKVVEKVGECVHTQKVADTVARKGLTVLDKYKKYFSEGGLKNMHRTARRMRSTMGN